MTELKILVCGDVNGHFKTLFNRVEVINKKRGPFEYLLCVGNFFGSRNNEWQDVLNGKISVPLSTYILGPNKQEHVKYYPELNEELTANVVYLGKRGLLTGCSGLRIAYLSGTQQRDSTSISFSKKDISELISYSSQYNVDILLTSQWPEGVTKYAKAPEHSDCCNSNLVASLAKELKPRYHFSGLSEIFYERLPYRNHKILQETPIHATRFIGLASVNNDKKLKWIYAFNLIPCCKMSAKQLAEVSGPVTECPYEDMKDDQINEFFYDTSSTSSRRKYSSEGEEFYKSKKRGKISITQDNCWFCLGNPNVEKHLLLCVGDHSYLALPKGGLVKEHLLILPIEHIEAATNLSETAYDEIHQFKKILSRYFYDKRKDVVFFERNFSSAHFQIQVVPIPMSVSANVKNSVFELGSAHGAEFSELPELALIKQIVPENKPYFYFEIVRNTRIETKLIYIINKHLPIQFGRMVLAHEDVLNLPQRVDWKACKESEDEEKELAEKFRDCFKPYDFIT